MNMPLRLAAIVISLLGPLAALAPRGMPVWLLALALAAAWGLATDRRRPALNDPVMAGAAAGLMLWAGASSLWSPSSRAALTALEIAYVGGSSFIIWAWLSELSDGRRHHLARIAAASIAAGMGIYAFEAAFSYPLHRLWNSDHSVGWLLASNVPKRAAALLALLVWPLSAVTAAKMAVERRRPWEMAISSICLVMATLLTSRSALFGLMAGALAYALTLISAAKRVRRALSAGVVAAFVLAVPAGAFLAYATSDLPTDGWSRSALHRMEIWGHAAARVMDAPIFGHGVDASRQLPIKGEISRFEPLANSALPLHPHNAFLQIWLELGAVGAALATLIVWRLLGLARTPIALGFSACALALASTAYGVWQAWWMSGVATAGLLTALAAGLAWNREGRS